ncbi:Xaa-Pro aminopeptidase [Myxococcus stipitatus]|uniref:Xaa-Pro aminopeptidase n=1 Tax=Myxococcus stipitatus TaxID=83455 RepID=UPI001F2E1789|nr:Xaa-Pro aminopeptidase [Myxococcus stipitatus]MCE9669737.1 Xaa-Pro aminopeptidase [Myxococcus stipitatus]
MHRFISKRSWSLGLAVVLSSASMACAAGEPESARVSEALVGTEAVSEEALRFLHCPAGGDMFAPGEVSLPERSEYRLSFTGDGNTAYYHVDLAEEPYQALFVTHKVNGHWIPGQIVPFSGTFQDSDPFVTPDGNTVYFSSARPVSGEGPQRSDTDLWVVRRDAGGDWGTPEHLGPNINSDRQELYVSATRDGTLYFASGTFDTDFNVYKAERRGPGYAPAEKLGAGVNSDDYWEYNSHISWDGRVLIFASLNRPEGYGLGDLYASVNVGGRWLKAVNLGPSVNTEKDEFHPSLSVDGRRLYFVRQTWAPFVPSDFYQLDTLCLLGL